MSKTKPPRSRLETDDRKQRLLDLGRTLFAKYNYEELSISDIAVKAGISKGLLYHYFPTKRDFYVETIREAADELLELIANKPERAPLENLRTGLSNYLKFVDEHSAAYISLMRGGIGVDPELVKIVEGVRDAVVDLIIEGVGEKRPTTIHKLALRGWVGFVEGAALQWLESKPVSAFELQKMLEQHLIFTLGTKGLASAAAKQAFDRIKAFFGQNSVPA